MIIRRKENTSCLETQTRGHRQSGQGLIEYLILVSLIAVATLGIVRLLGHSLSARFSNVTLAIQGRNPRQVEVESVQKQHYKKRDMSDFFNGASARDEKN